MFVQEQILVPAMKHAFQQRFSGQYVLASKVAYCDKNVSVSLV